MAKDYRREEEIEFRFFIDGELFKTEHVVRLIHGNPDPAARKPRYVLNLGNRQEALTSDHPPVIERHTRSVRNTRPL